MYDFLECSACGLEEESQKHSLECSALLSLNEESEETPKYENLFERDIEDQMKIAKLFINKHNYGRPICFDYKKKEVTKANLGLSLFELGQINFNFWLQCSKMQKT